MALRGIEFPMMSESKPAADPSAETAKPGSIRTEVLIAGAILGLVTGGLALYVGTTTASDKPENRELSAADWVGEKETSAENDSASAPENTEPENRYAPTEEELHSDDSGTPETTPEVEGAVVKQGTVKKGTAVINSLTSLGLTRGQAHTLITALDGIFDFREARPGQSFEVHMDNQSGDPIYFRYDASLGEIYEVKKKNDKLVGKKKEIPTQIKTRRFGGTISSSLYKALAEMDAHPSLTGRIVDVFSFDVKFFKAQRPGDTFRVVVEEESLDNTFLGYGPVLALEYNGTKSGKKRLFRFQAGNDNPTYYSEKGISVPRSVIVIPLHYTRMSSPFGMRYHPVLKRRIMHTGVDFAAPRGTPIWACRDGTITFAGKKGANGNLVIINHDDNLVSIYAHLERFASAAKAGRTVRARQVIGYVGSTGRSTGPHLHFGVKKNGRFIDPLKYKVRPGRPAPAKYQPQLNEVISKYGRILNNTKILPPASPVSEEEEDDEVLGLEEL